MSVSNQILKLHDNDMMDLFTCLHPPSRNKTAVKRPLPNPGLMWDLRKNLDDVMLQFLPESRRVGL